MVVAQCGAGLASAAVQQPFNELNDSAAVPPPLASHPEPGDAHVTAMSPLRLTLYQ